MTIRIWRWALYGRPSAHIYKRFYEFIVCFGAPSVYGRSVCLQARRHPMCLRSRVWECWSQGCSQIYTSDGSQGCCHMCTCSGSQGCSLIFTSFGSQGCTQIAGVYTNIVHLLVLGHRGVARYVLVLGHTHRGEAKFVLALNSRDWARYVLDLSGMGVVLSPTQRVKGVDFACVAGTNSYTPLCRSS